MDAIDYIATLENLNRTKDALAARLTQLENGGSRSKAAEDLYAYLTEADDHLRLARVALRKAMKLDNAGR